MVGGSSKRVCQRLFFGEVLEVEQQQKTWFGSFLQGISEDFPYLKRLISVDGKMQLSPIQQSCSPNAIGIMNQVFPSVFADMLSQ